MTCGVVLLNCVGALIAYNNIFGSICASIFLVFSDNTESIFASHKIYILALAILNMPIIFRRTVGELKFISFLLFVSMFVYITALFTYLGIKKTSLNPDKDYS